MVKISWLKKAIDDLNDIGSFIACDSPKYADLLIDRIFEKADLLKQHPRIGRVVPEINNPEIRELIEGNYRIIYEIKSATEIEILTIHHSSRSI